MVLLELASQTFPRSSLVVAHYHHGTRDSADHDLALVKAAAGKMKIPFVSGRYPGKWNTPPSEATLRVWRRRFLREVIQQHDCDYILTAHHLNDQLETLFMRLLRGTGVRGLSGMAARQGRWLKPLLSVTRTELQNFAREAKLEWNEDESNQDPRYLRNRIRQELIPLFMELGKPFGTETQILRRIGGTTRELGEWYQRERKRMARRTGKVFIFTPFWLRFSDREWKRLSTEVSRHMFLKAALESLGITRITRPTLRRLAQSLDAQKKQIPLQNGASARYSLGHWFWQTGPQREALRRAVPACQVTLKRQDWKVRTHQPGDRLRSTKLKKIFGELRIPEPERGLLPIVLNEQAEVVWFYPQSSPPDAVIQIACEFPFSFAAPHL